jgi:hypothetical protein
MIDDYEKLFMVKQLVFGLMYLHLIDEEPVIHGHLISTSIFVKEDYSLIISDIKSLMNIENIEMKDLFDSSAIGDESLSIPPEFFSSRISVFSDIF